MSEAMSERQPARPAKATMHEVIFGSAAWQVTADRLAEELAWSAAESWVADPDAALGEWCHKVCRYGCSIEEIRGLLIAVRDVALRRSTLLVPLASGVVGLPPRAAGQRLPLLVVTIQGAPAVLGDGDCRSAVQQALYMARPCGIKFRMAVPTLALESFGDNEVIRSQLLHRGSATDADAGPARLGKRT